MFLILVNELEQQQQNPVHLFYMEGIQDGCNAVTSFLQVFSLMNLSEK